MKNFLIGIVLFVVIVAGVFMLSKNNELDSAKKAETGSTRLQNIKNANDVPRVRRSFTGKVKTKELEPLLSSEDVVRRKAYESLYKNLFQNGSGSYYKYGIEILAYLAYGLSDPNEGYAQNAAAIVYEMSMASFIKRYQGIEYKKGFPYIDSSIELRLSLIDAIQNSPNKEVKKLSAVALAQGYELTKDIEDVLISEFQRKDNPSIAREGMASALEVIARQRKTSGFFNDTTLPIILDAINESDEEISHIAINIVIHTRPKEAIPILVKKLKVVSRPYEYRGILVALEDQKNSAKLYITDIEEIMNKATDEKFKAAIYKTLNLIKK